MNDYLNFLDGRVSVRQFDPDAVLPNDLIKDMLEHASYAPSGNNFQPWRVVVVKNKNKQEDLKKLAALQPQVATASAVFLLFGDENAYDLTWWQELSRKMKQQRELNGFVSTLTCTLRIRRLRVYD